MFDSRYIVGFAFGAGTIFLVFMFGGFLDGYSLANLQKWMGSLSGWVAAIVTAIVGLWGLKPLVDQVNISRSKEKVGAIRIEIDNVEKMHADLDGLIAEFDTRLREPQSAVMWRSDEKGFILDIEFTFSQLPDVVDVANFILGYRAILAKHLKDYTEFAEVDDERITKEMSVAPIFAKLTAQKKHACFIRDKAKSSPKVGGTIYSGLLKAANEALESAYCLRAALVIRQQRLLEALPKAKRSLYFDTPVDK